MAVVSVLIGGLGVVLSYPYPERVYTYFSTIGIIATWRYGWMLTHFVRARIFLGRHFPGIRAAADQADADGAKFDHLYAIVMSYRIPPPEFYCVYDALIKNVVSYGVPTTIIASVTSDRDRGILNKIYLANGSPASIEIVTQFQKGDGKRSAMGMALRALSRRLPNNNSAVVFLDGDVLLDTDALPRTLSVLQAQPELGAVTTNNDAIVDGSYLTQKWYKLRYAQRHMLMASMALGRRLLVLTGRYSVFRTSLVVQPQFIDVIENDYLTHWRFGRFRFVSGDDKSTWYELIKRRVKMVYIPDVYVRGFESLPDPDRFFSSTSQLMIRWFGNMLRTNGRAIRLGPKTTGFFLWWTLIDQRISMWTSIVGPTVAILFGLTVAPIFIAFYLVWVCITRITLSILFGSYYGQYSASWPFLLLYNQLGGALLKIYLLFHLNKQGWTRQKLGTNQSESRTIRQTSCVLGASAVLLFVLVIATSIGQLALPGRTDAEVMFKLLGFG